MLWIYNTGITLYHVLLKVVALFNPKAKLFVEGRKNIFAQIKAKIDPNNKPIWFHFASLGEFEQGRPVLEKIKSIYPEQHLVVTFFSPSGYEIRKNYALATVFYLPLDTAKNATKFIEIVNPKLAIFTKYEFWYHYFKTLNKNQIPLYLISGIFRPDQLFFKWYGSLNRKILSYVNYFFVQNTESVNLLKSLGINNVSLSGDTRFDRVFENANEPKDLPLISRFCGKNPVFVAGSTWLPDENLIADLITDYPEWKFIIAPHEIQESHLLEIEKLFLNSIRFSILNKQNDMIQSKSIANNSVLIIDNIGMLSSLYKYGNLAYIGGGFGVGIHNTLEAAAFGLPVIFGPIYDKFQEAKDLISIEAAKSITNLNELKNAFTELNANERAGQAAKKYVEVKKGATAEIIAAIQNKL